MINTPIFTNVRKTSSITGMSCKAIRKGCKDGSIPHIRVGEGENARFMINLPKYMEQLNRDAAIKQ